MEGWIVFFWRTNLEAIFSLTDGINNLISNLICFVFIQQYFEILMHWKMSWENGETVAHHLQIQFCKSWPADHRWKPCRGLTRTSSSVIITARFCGCFNKKRRQLFWCGGHELLYIHWWTGETWTEKACHRTDSAFIPRLGLAIRLVCVLLLCIDVINDDNHFIYRFQGRHRD